MENVRFTFEEYRARDTIDSSLSRTAFARRRATTLSSLTSATAVRICVSGHVGGGHAPRRTGRSGRGSEIESFEAYVLLDLLLAIAIRPML